MPEVPDGRVRWADLPAELRVGTSVLKVLGERTWCAPMHEGIKRKRVRQRQGQEGQRQEAAVVRTSFGCSAAAPSAEGAW